MDAMRGFDPSVNMMHSRATQNLSHIGFGAVRSQKEVTQKQEDTSDEVQDNVQLSLSSLDDTPDAEEMTKNAAQSGALSEEADDYTDDEEEIRERKFHEQEYEFAHVGSTHDPELVQELDSQELQRLSEMDNDALAAREILSDVPSRSLEPAKNIIANQIQDSRPTESLAALKPVEGVNAIDFEPAASLGILDIHDSQNQPIVADSGEEIDPQQRQSLAEDYINSAIEALPEDRKSMVSDLRQAVNSWASASGVDPKAAFAEKLRDLAAGWDDESLQAVAQTYVDADRELATSAAG